MIGKLTYYERWIVSAINVLLEKRVLTPISWPRRRPRSRCD